MNWKQILKTDVTTVLRGFVPPHVFHARRGHRWPGPLYFHRAFWRRDLMVVTAQLQAIVKCNAPLVQGLELAAWDAPRRKVQVVLQALRDNLASGMGLHEAMAMRGRFFPPYYVDLVKVGDMSGCLPETLDQLQRHLAAEKERSNTIWGWAAYFAIVLFIQLAAFLVLSLRVFPELYAALSDFGIELPPMFNVMVYLGSITDVFRNRILLVVGAAGVLLVLLLLFLSVFAAGTAQHRIKGLGYLIPYIRGIMVRSDLAMVSGVLSRLLHAGVPLNEALSDAVEMNIGSGLRDSLRTLKRRIEEGMPLRQAVSAEGRFPQSFQALVSLGDSSGRLDSAFARIAAVYEANTLKTTRMLIDTVCPCGVIVLSLIVLYLEVSVFALLTTLADYIGGFA